MKVWEGDEVGFLQAGNSKKGVSDLLDYDGAGEGDLLAIVTLELIRV